MTKMDKKKVADAKEILYQIFEFVSGVLAAAVIATSLFTLVFRIIFKVEVVKIFGYSGLIILTGSMEPSYYPGDVIFIKEQNEYDVNDVITFHQRGMIVTHRIVDKKGIFYQTQGDANNVADERIKINDIEGKVVGSISKIGRIILFLQTPLGIAALVVVLVSLEIYFAARRKMVEQ